MENIEERFVDEVEKAKFMGRKKEILGKLEKEIVALFMAWCKQGDSLEETEKFIDKLISSLIVLINTGRIKIVEKEEK